MSWRNASARARTGPRSSTNCSNSALPPGKKKRVRPPVTEAEPDEAEYDEVEYDDEAVEEEEEEAWFPIEDYDDLPLARSSICSVSSTAKSCRCARVRGRQPTPRAVLNDIGPAAHAAAAPPAGPAEEGRGTGSPCAGAVKNRPEEEGRARQEGATPKKAAPAKKAAPVRRPAAPVRRLRPRQEEGCAPAKNGARPQCRCARP